MRKWEEEANKKKSSTTNMTNWKTRFNPHEWKTNSRDKDSSLLISVIHSSAQPISVGWFRLFCRPPIMLKIHYMQNNTHTQTNKFQNKKIKLSLPRQVLPIDLVRLSLSSRIGPIYSWTMTKKNKQEQQQHDVRLFSKRLYIYAWVSQVFFVYLICI